MLKNKRKSCFYFAVNGATYKKLGDEAVLSPGSMPNLITSITWKHGPDIAVEWYGKETFAYREFKGTFNSKQLCVYTDYMICFHAAIFRQKNCETT